MRSCSFLFPFVLFGCTATAFAADPDEMRVVSGIAAIANDALVTIREANVMAVNAAPSLANAAERNPAQYARQWNRVKIDAAEHLIERQLILDDFKSSGLVFPESLIEDQIQDIIRGKYGNRRTM